MTQGDMYGGMGPGPDDDWMSRRMWWIAMMLGKIPGPSETIQYGIESQVRVPTMQAGTGILSTVGFMVGLGMMVTQLLWASGFKGIGLGDAVLVGTIGLVMLLVFAMASTLYLNGANDKIRWGVSAGAALICIAGFLYGIIEFRASMEGIEFFEGIWRGLSVMVGTGLTVYCAALCYRFLSELIDPLFPEPPALRLINKLLGPDLMKGDTEPQAEVVEQRTPIPVNFSGGKSMRVDMSTVDGEFVHIERELARGPIGFVIDPESGNLIWYVMLAHKIGLSRPAAERMNLYLPYNESDDPQVRRKLNKATHTQLIWRGAELSWWFKQGQGSTPIWNEKLGKDGVLQQALDMWHQLTDGEIPPPDPWTSKQYQRGVLYHSPGTQKGVMGGDVPASQVDNQPVKDDGDDAG